MAIQINRITNANIYLDGGSMLGRSEEIKLPDIVSKMTEHKSLGMVATAEFFAGIEKMSGEIKWSSFYPDVMAKVGNPFKFVSLQARSSVSTYNAQGLAEEKPMVTLLTVAFTQYSGGNFKQHDNAEFPGKFSCYYMKQIVDGEDVIELDVLSNIFKVQGVDLLANYRANVE